MNRVLFSFLCLLFLASQVGAEELRSFYDLSARRISGEEIPFSTYRGKVILVVNIALQCGTTQQLADVQAVYEKYRSRGLMVLGFPSNDLTGESEDSDYIHATCESRYGVSFPLFQPGRILKETPQAVYQFLTSKAPKKDRGPVQFNFEKFLIDNRGRVRYRFGSFTGANSHVLTQTIEALLLEETEK